MSHCIFKFVFYILLVYSTEDMKLVEISNYNNKIPLKKKEKKKKHVILIKNVAL